MLVWIAQYILPAPLAPPGEDERQDARDVRRESRATTARVNLIVDTWHQRMAPDMTEAERAARIELLDIQSTPRGEPSGC